jgi:hypothetical protein
MTFIVEKMPKSLRLCYFRNFKKMPKENDRPIGETSPPRVVSFFLVQHRYQNGKIYLNGQKMYKLAKNIPHGSEIYQMAKIYRHLSMQDTPKFTQIGIFV